MHTIPTSTDTPAIDPTDVFASSVEWRRETCRNGRQLITAVNTRTGDAAYVSATDLESLANDEDETAVARDLRMGGFLTGSDIEPTDVTPSTRRRGDGIVWTDADRFVRRVYLGRTAVLFLKRGVIAQSVLAAIGVIAFVHLASNRELQLRAEPAHIPIIVMLGLIAVAIHEFGHAVVTVHHGRSVRGAGLRLHLGSPTFYVDSADALLLTRRQRLAQAAAGPWAEWLATSVAAIVLLGLPEASGAGVVLQRFVIINAFGIALNLVPFVGLDGALILADLVREPDLQYRARTALRDPWSLTERDRWLVGYALANSLVAGVLLVTAVFFWWELFGGLVEQLARSGVIGIATLSLLGGASIWHASPWSLGVARSLGFRMERRWRVRAMKAFMELPQFGSLDARTLGVLAGRLERIEATAIDAPLGSDALYLERDRRLVNVDDVFSAQRAVFLPADWRRLVPTFASCVRP